MTMAPELVEETRELRDAIGGCASDGCGNDATIDVMLVGKPARVCAEHAIASDAAPMLLAAKADPTPVPDLLQMVVRHCGLVQNDWTPAEREQRRKTLGSSEIAAVLGVNPYASLHNVWLSKCRSVEFEGNERTLLGKLLEPAIMAIYSDRYGVELTKGEYTVGPEPWMSATPDARRNIGGLVEAKLVGLRSIWMWGTGNTEDTESDAVPLHYLAQAQWQLIVTGEPFCDVAALMGTEFRSYRIRANADLQARMVERARAFWERYVVTGKEPPVDASDGAREMLKRLYPQSDAAPVEADAQLDELAEALLAAREALKEAEAAKQLRENQIKERIRDARGARGTGWHLRYATTKKGTRPFVFSHEREKGHGE